MSIIAAAELAINKTLHESRSSYDFPDIVIEI